FLRPRRAGVELAERLEDALDVLFRNADAGVGDGEHGGVAEAPDADLDRSAGRGELHGIAGEIDDDLPEAALVAADGDRRRGGAEGEAHAVLPCPRLQHAAALGDDFAELDRLELEREVPGVELGEIENVADQLGEVLPALDDVGGVLDVPRVT